jgi:hypothetical protein
VTEASASLSVISATTFFVQSAAAHSPGTVVHPAGPVLEGFVSDSDSVMGPVVGMSVVVPGVSVVLGIVVEGDVGLGLVDDDVGVSVSPPSPAVSSEGHPVTASARTATTRLVRFGMGIGPRLNES